MYSPGAVGSTGSRGWLAACRWPVAAYSPEGEVHSSELGHSPEAFRIPEQRHSSGAGFCKLRRRSGERWASPTNPDREVEVGHRTRTQEAEVRLASLPSVEVVVGLDGVNNNGINTILGRGGGRVVSALALSSEDLSSNHAGYVSLYSIVVRRDENKFSAFENFKACA